MYITATIARLIGYKLFMVLHLIAQLVIGITSLVFIDSFSISVPCLLWVGLHCFILLSGRLLAKDYEPMYSFRTKPTYKELYKYWLCKGVNYVTLAITCVTLLIGFVNWYEYSKTIPVTIVFS